MDKHVLDFDDGRIEYRLGKTGRSIFLNPADVDFAKRLTEAKNNIEKKFDELKQKHKLPKDLALDDVGSVDTGDIETDLNVMRETSEYIKGQLNYAFDYDVSAAAFGNASCLSVTKNGEFYFENFLNCVLPAIEKEFGVRIDKIKVRTKAYLDRKGQHPATKR